MFVHSYTWDSERMHGLEVGHGHIGWQLLLRLCIVLGVAWVLVSIYVGFKVHIKLVFMILITRYT